MSFSSPKRAKIASPSASPQSSPLLAQIESMTVADFLKEQPQQQPIVLDCETSLLEGYKTLIKSHILSAPVRSDKTWIGFLDLRDLVTRVVIALEGLSVPPDKTFFENLLNGGQDNIREFVRQPFASVVEHDSLLKVIELLRGNIRRVAVVTTSNEIRAILSQSAIIAYLGRTLAVSDPFFQETAICTSPVVSVGQGQPALQAFALMHQHNLSGLAVVDETGKVIGNTSASDIKMLFKAPELIYKATVLSFLSAVRMTFDLHTRANVMSVPKGAAVGEAVQKLAATRVHRVFVVCPAHKCVGVISVRDVLGQLLRSATRGPFASLEALVAVPVGDLLARGRPPIVVHARTAPLQAFRTLIQNHILSAPVFDGDEYQGFLDVSDLVAAVAFTVNQAKRQTPPLGEGDQFLENAFARAPPDAVARLGEQDSFRLGDVGSLFSPGDVNIKRGDAVTNLTTSYLCKRHPYRPVAAQDPLSRAIALLTQRDVHRVPVLAGERLVGVLSQSAVIGFLAAQLPAPGFLGSPMAGFFAQQAERSPRPLVFEHIGASALSVFTLMYQDGVSGLPLVDDEGALVGQISASDLKLFLTRPSGGLLSLPVLEFLSAVRQTQLHTRAAVVSVGPEATVAQVIRKLAATGLHRVYVADKAKRPIGVISLGDLLRQLMKVCPQCFE